MCEVVPQESLQLVHQDVLGHQAGHRHQDRGRSSGKYRDIVEKSLGRREGEGVTIEIRADGKESVCI